MARVLLLILALLAAAFSPARADEMKLPERILGKADAPVTVEEYISLTCPHCAEFYIKTLPELEKRYVDTGKVRFILRDFPLDGVALKGATVARCMPEDEFYPFISVLYNNQKNWALSPNPDQILIQYAKLGGLAEDKARACLKNSALQDAVVAERTLASEKVGVQATPTFVINGTEKMEGDKSVAEFAAVFDRLLASKK